MDNKSDNIYHARKESSELEIGGSEPIAEECELLDQGKRRLIIQGSKSERDDVISYNMDSVGAGAATSAGQHVAY